MIKPKKPNILPVRDKVTQRKLVVILNFVEQQEAYMAYLQDELSKANPKQYVEDKRQSKQLHEFLVRMENIIENDNLTDSVKIFKLRGLTESFKN